MMSASIRRVLEGMSDFTLTASDIPTVTDSQGQRTPLCFHEGFFEYSFILTP